MKISILGVSLKRRRELLRIANECDATTRHYSDYRQIGPTQHQQAPSLASQRIAVQRTLLEMAEGIGEHLYGDDHAIRTGYAS